MGVRRAGLWSEWPSVRLREMPEKGPPLVLLRVGWVPECARTKPARNWMPDASTEASEADYQVKFVDWDKHFVAAMEGKGYTVK